MTLPKHYCFSIFIILVLLFGTDTVNARMFKIKNRKIVDLHDRQVTFHGTNVVMKTPPYIPTTGQYQEQWSFGPQDVKLLKDNGFNSIRLGIMWAGAQPKKDWYNTTYFEQMVKIVNMAGQAGIYSLVEFHQDLLAEKFCGDGAPTWLMDEINSYKTFPYPIQRHIKLNQSGLPGWDKCNHDIWGAYYFSYDVGQGFANLYNPNHRLNQKFTQYWKKTAEYFKGNPYVIAYELINEPFIGNFWRNPFLVIPSVAERAKFQAFYDRLSYSIRQVDPDTPICFQPITFDNIVPSGFTHPPGGHKYQNLSAFCYHYYKPPSLGLSTIDAGVKNGIRLGIPSILSETFGDQQTLNRAEKYHQSWMYWHYKDYGKDWGSGFKLRMNTMKQQQSGIDSDNDNTDPSLANALKSDNKSIIADRLVRTYMPFVAGQLIDAIYNSKTGHYTASYWATPEGVSQLFLSKDRSYNSGYELVAYPKSNIQIIQDDSNTITIKYTGNTRSRVSISIYRL